MNFAAGAGATTCTSQLVTLNKMYRICQQELTTLPVHVM
jgi:hypothetical protein